MRSQRQGEDSTQPPPRLCGGQAVAAARVREAHEASTHSDDHEATLPMNLQKIAEEVVMMSRGFTLLEVVHQGAQEQWDRDMDWTLDVMLVTEPSCPMYWGDGTGCAGSARSEKCAKA